MLLELNTGITAWMRGCIQGHQLADSDTINAKLQMLPNTGYDVDLPIVY